MPTTYRATLTNVGAALVADAIAQGTTLTWAKMALGDGNGSAVIVDAGRTSLVNERYRAPLNDLGRDSANPNTIVGTLVVPPETGGWTIREFGIYDNASTPRLVAYGETPEIEKPASAAGTGINLRLRFKLAVSADANITFSPDSNEAYATIEYVKDNAVKSLSVIGRTITYTMGDGDTHTLQTQDTTYSDATQSMHGLMSATDKTALDNVPTMYLPLTGGTLTGNLVSKTNVVRGTAPSVAVDRYLYDIKDSNNVRYGLIDAVYRANKSSEIAIYAYNTTVASGNNIGRLGIGCDVEGNIVTIAPTPSVSDDSTKIATTAYVKNCVPKSIGSATKPVYINADGVVSACTNELKKTVPANAVFTDTVPIIHNLGSGYSMSKDDFSTVGDLYHVASFATGKSPDSEAVGDYWLVLLSNNLNWNCILCVSPRLSGAVFIGNFANGVWDGWKKLTLDTDLNFLPLSGGTLTGTLIMSPTNSVIRKSIDTGAMVLDGASADANGGQVVLYGKDHGTSPGNFNIRARNGTNNKVLKGTPDGVLQWDGKDVEVVVNANITNTNGYVKYKSGLQMCWGDYSTTASGQSVTFPVAFNSTPRINCFVSPVSIQTASDTCAVPLNRSATGFTGYLFNTSGPTTGNCSYLAIGYAP